MMLPCHILISRKVDAYGTTFVDVMLHLRAASTWTAFWHS
jgi:hypothetical protein